MAGLNYTRIEVKMGFFVAFCGSLFIAMLFSFGHVGALGPFWKQRQQINVAFDNVGGLTIDDPVRYNGLEIGRVKSLKVLHLDDALIERLPTPLTKRDLDNLPVRPDTLIKQLRTAADADFD